VVNGLSRHVCHKRSQDRNRRAGRRTGAILKVGGSLGRGEGDYFAVDGE